MSFEALGIEASLLQGIHSLGFTEPTPIQQQAIPILLSGTKDFVGLAQTGTGKTAAFGLPLLQLVDSQARHPQALVVCPTRELCMQITKDLANFSSHKNAIRSVAVYGGASIGEQIRDLKRGVQTLLLPPAG